MLKIWGRVNSVNVQKALLCLEELGVPHERIEAGLHHGVVGTPEYRAMNPNGVVPTIEDDGFVLWESNVIVRYLSAKHGVGRLWSSDVRERADADRWMDWQQTTFNPPLTVLFWSRVRAPDKPPIGDVAASGSKLDAAAAVLDAGLQGHDYLAGEKFTMADCAIAPSLHRFMHLPGSRTIGARMERYYKRLMQRPSAQKLLTLPLT